MSEQEKVEEVVEEAAPASPIKIECPLDGRPENFILYKRAGWKFKHFRLWEQSDTAALIELICERIEDWHMIDLDGKKIKFDPYDMERDSDDEIVSTTIKPDAIDELDPALSAWLVTSFRMAYTEAGLPDPN